MTISSNLAIIFLVAFVALALLQVIVARLYDRRLKSLGLPPDIASAASGAGLTYLQFVFRRQNKNVNDRMLRKLLYILRVVCMLDFVVLGWAAVVLYS
jgi:hypothetical protein